MATGKVKWFKDETGFGFIEVDDEFLEELGDRSSDPHPKDIFVHYSGIERDSQDPDKRRTLEKNARVSFSITEGKKRNPHTGVEEITKQAVNVVVIG